MVGPNVLRQDDVEDRTSAFCIFHGDRTFHSLNDLADYPQSNAETAVLLTSPDDTLETSEDALPVIYGNTTTMVPDTEKNLAAEILSADRDRLAIAILDGIGDEVVDDLLQG